MKCRWPIAFMRLGPLLLMLGGCAFDAPPANPPSPSLGTFRDAVYPVLLRDCGFPACHGDTERFFRVYGPGRTRLDGLATGAPLDDEEIRASYDRARSMLSSAGRAEDTLLLRKPLEVDVGGAPHMGIDQHGRDIYQTTADDGYTTIRRWVLPVFPEAAP